MPAARGLTHEGAVERPAGKPVVVAYATRFGSTTGVAERLAARLTEGGLLAEARQVDTLPGLGPYEAVLLGSPVFDGHWLPEAEGFARRHRGALADTPLWLFSVGSFDDRKPFLGPLMKREPRNIRDLSDALRPIGYRVFAGVMPRERWPLLGRAFFRLFGGRFGDNRDWDAIDRWADEIVAALRARAT
jgi:menaquinone-dependent protoporphyrinogen oxidase